MKSKILTVLSVLFGITFINSGLNKFFNYMPMPDDLPEAMVEMFTAMTQIGWLMPLIAIVEILGGLLMISKKFRALGAIVIFPIMIGILLTHITVAPSGLPLAIVLFAILLWVMYENRVRYMALIKYNSK